MQAPIWPGVLCGLEAEAVIARQFLGHIAISGGRPAKAAIGAQALLAQGVSGLVSFGIAGGLDPALKTGDLVIADQINVPGGERLKSDADWVASLRKALPRAHVGTIAGADKIIARVDDKADLFQSTGALAVDMESHIAARAARAADKPFIALRVIADPADFALPDMTAYGLDENGRPMIWPILWRLAFAPWTLPALIHTGSVTNLALSELLRCGGVGLLSLGGFGGMNVSHGLLDMA
jgi:hopanoid-associated phosphorylase